ncbi:MAG: (Fe-S)-binding protein [Bacteroidota bacterium]
MNYDIIVNCMHCGLCLPTCPTYALTGNERSSPRGRIRLMKSIADGELTFTDTFIDEMDFCLDCQACETACPAGVKYGELVEAARSDIAEQGREPWLRRIIKGFFLGWLLPRRNRLQTFARIIGWFERTGLREAIRESGLLGLLSPRMHSLEGLTPSVSKNFSSDLLPLVLPPLGKQRFRVGFLTGCIMDVAFSDVNMDTVEVLRYHGCEVVIPRNQECCGSLHAHNGDRKTARMLAELNIAAFDDESFDAIVMNSSGCGAFMKEYGHLFADSPRLAEKAARLSSRIKDITEFLDETGFFPTPVPGAAIAGKRVSYHDACHLVHTQKISSQPRRLIQKVSGIAFNELPESTWCCGSAGIYNILRHDDSMKLLDRKVANIRSVDPEIVVTGNPGCLLQIQHGLRAGAQRIEVMHTSTFLRHACAI